MNRVLLVEDDADVALITAEALRSAGVEVETVSSVAAALASLERRAPDAAIIDVGLPDGSGWNVATRAAGAGVPAAIFTVHAGDGDVISRAREHGWPVAAKSGDPVEIIGLVRDMLGKEAPSTG